MCGIFGFFGLSGSRPPPGDLLDRMALRLYHRGPDEGGFFRERPVGLGSRRLSIVDLETGRQPLRNETGEIQLVCNGEIYNAPDLRRDLESRHPFRTRSDVEVLLHLYEEQGSGFLESVEGMFALALWDRRKRQMLLARDRAGEKPLFYAVHRGTFYFASELSALREVDGLGLELEPRALRLYLTFGYFPAPWSPYRGVQKLPPGHLALVEAGSASPRLARYWSLRPHALAGALRQDGALEEARRVLSQKVESSVRRQLMSDVPIGVALSGGIDSGWIAAIASAEATEPIHCFTVSFSDPSYDESSDAARWARKLGAIHHLARADRPSLVRALDVLSRHLDEPLGDPAVLPTFLLAEEARRRVKVLLGGEGADELFGGYPTYLGHLAARRYVHWPARLRESILRPLIEALPSSEKKVSLEFLLKRFVRAAERPLLARHLAWFGVLSPEESVSLPGPLVGASRERNDALFVLENLLEDEDEWGAAELEKVLYLDFLTYLGEGLLTKLDRVSMACSIESRSPYLSRDVVELAAALPIEWKVRGFATKRILRLAARDSVPAAVLRRRKRGLSVPLAGMFRRELRELLLSELDPGRLSREGLLDGKSVFRLVTEHLDGGRDRSRALWAILSLVLWYRNHATGNARRVSDGAPATATLHSVVAR